MWKDWNCVATFKDHLQAVWAVLAVDEDRVLTGEYCLWASSDLKRRAAAPRIEKLATRSTVSRSDHDVLSQLPRIRSSVYGPSRAPTSQLLRSAATLTLCAA